MSARASRCRCDRRPTTSPAAHRGEDRPRYDGPVAYVKDASRAVGVCQSLVTPEHRAEFVARLKVRPRRAARAAQGPQGQGAGIHAGRGPANRFRCDWAAYRPPVPKMAGVRRFENLQLEELVRYIDWMPFFNAWEFAAGFPTFSPTRSWARRREQPLRGRAPDAQADDFRALGPGERGDRVFPCKRGGRRHRGVCGRVTHAGAAPPAPPAPAEAETHRTAALRARRLRRAARFGRQGLDWRLRGHDRHRPRRESARVRSAPRRLRQHQC